MAHTTRRGSGLTIVLMVAALPGCGGEAGGGAVEMTTAVGPPVVRDVLDYRAQSVVLFEGMSAPAVMPRVRPRGPVRVAPALPAGLTLDAQTGAVGGAARRAAPGAVYIVRDAAGATGALWIEVLKAPSRERSRFVSPAGRDDNPGTVDRPFRTVGRGVRDLGPGMTLFLRQGVYRESVELRRLAGTAQAPITIRSYPGERAVIDASVPVFAEQPGRAWERYRGPGAHRDEWVSAQAYPAEGKDTSSRGAFLDRLHYTRLLTYSRIEDLRAANETWELSMAAGDRRPGPRITGSKKRPVQPGGERLPWTYFGPGLHFDQRSGRIHIRLSPTRHGVQGLEEYRGPSDPRQLQLAISSRDDIALRVAGSEHVRIADVGLHHGGDETVRIESSQDVTLDHVEIRAATYGLAIAASERVRVLHSRLDGGIPPWSFRSDFKGSYNIADGRGRDDGERQTNNLVRKTQRALLFMARRNVDVEIAHCEIENGHDVYVAGTRTDFHHNRIHNIHDEAFYLQAAADESGLRIHHNVIEQVLSGVSFGGRGGGARYIYRNLFDLRAPTAGHRPGAQRDRDPWRYGHPFKNTGNLGELYFYQNTVLVNRPPKVAFLQFSAFEKDESQIGHRWFLNNVFVVLQPDEDGEKPISFVPPPRYAGLRDRAGQPLLRSDGNLWVRMPGGTRPMFRCIDRNRRNDCDGRKLWRLSDTASGMRGFEGHSRMTDRPGFRRAKDLSRAGDDDDLRPGAGSLAIGRGVGLPRGLPDARRGAGRPDAGALAAGQEALRVGVDGRLVY